MNSSHLSTPSLPFPTFFHLNLGNWKEPKRRKGGGGGASCVSNTSNQLQDDATTKKRREKRISLIRIFRSLDMGRRHVTDEAKPTPSHRTRKKEKRKEGREENLMQWKKRNCKSPTVPMLYNMEQLFNWLRYRVQVIDSPTSSRFRRSDNVRLKAMKAISAVKHFSAQKAVNFVHGFCLFLSSSSSVTRQCGKRRISKIIFPPSTFLFPSLCLLPLIPRSEKKTNFSVLRAKTRKGC